MREVIARCDEAEKGRRVGIKGREWDILRGLVRDDELFRVI